jgi:F0F1-type ATP synthase membrane subunit b/b'
MNVDDLTREVVERTIELLRPELETRLRGLAEEAARVVSDERVGAAVREAEATLDAARREADEQLGEASEEAERKLAGVRSHMSARIADLERQVVEARAAAESEARTNQFEVEKEHHAELAGAAERVHAEMRASALAGAAQLVESVCNIDKASSLGDALVRLAQGAHHEADRVAVLVLKEQRLKGWSMHGFDDVETPGAISLDPDDGGILGQVVRTGARASSDEAEPDSQTALPAFAGAATARHAMALPVLVGETVVAVLYADVRRTDHPVGKSTWPFVLEVLTRHAGRMLEAMMVAQASGVTIPRRAVG